MWGTTWDGDDVADGSTSTAYDGFTVKIYADDSGKYQKFSEFGFVLPNITQIDGVGVAIKAKWESGVMSVRYIKVYIYREIALQQFSVSAGSVCYASDGRKSGETTGNGSGVIVYYDGDGNCISTTTGELISG